MPEASANPSLRQHAKTLLRATAAYGINSVVGPILTLILTPIYARILTPADYGILEVVLTFSSFLAILAALGLRTATPVLFQRQSDDLHQRRLIASALWLCLAASLLLTWASAIGADQIAAVWLRNPTYANLVILAVANLPAPVLSTLLIDALRLRQEIWRASLLSLLQIVFLAIANITFVIVLRWGAVGVLSAQLSAQLTLLFIGCLIAPHLLFVPPNRQVLLPLLRAGLPLIPAGIASVALGVANRPILLQFGISAEQIGMFGIGNKLASMLAFLSVPFQAAWLPFALSIRNKPEAPRTYARVLSYYLAVMMTATLGLSLFAREALIVVGGYRYLPAQDYVWLLAYTALIQGSYVILSTGLYLSEKTVHLAWTSLVGALVSVLLMLALTPHLGILGAAIATPIGYLFGPLGAYLSAQRHYPIPYALRDLILIVVIELALLWIGLPLAVETNLISLGLRALLWLSYPALLLICKVITWQEVQLALKVLARLKTRLRTFGRAD
jgi:Membrane protein involved in the export of O-antigen and teichoic acid